MRLSTSLLWTILGILVPQINIAVASSNQTLQCDFLDSTNITAGIRHEDGSISFKGVDYAKRLYAEVNYNIISGEKVPAEPHLRGCLYNMKTRKSFLAYGMLTTVPFISATFLVYMLVPELRNIPGKCLLSYLTALLLQYISILITLFSTAYIEPISCRIIGHLIYFSTISSLLWLNTISFDAYSAFTKLNYNDTSSKRKRFTFYMIYAWGLSILLTCLTYGLDSMEWLPEYLKPRIGIGTKSCFFNKDHQIAKFLYYILPMFILVPINTIFFVVAAIKIRRTQNDFNEIGSKENGSQGRTQWQRENFVLFFRLFVVMGVGQMNRVLLWLAWYMKPTSGNNWWFILSDIFYLLQGVLIFVLFVLKRRVLQLVRNRLVYASNNN